MTVHTHVNLIRHGFLYVHTVIAPRHAACVDLQLQGSAVSWFFLLPNIEVMLEERPAGLNLYVVVRRYDQLCKRRLVRLSRRGRVTWAPPPPTGTYMW